MPAAKLTTKTKPLMQPTVPPKQGKPQPYKHKQMATLLPAKEPCKAYYHKRFKLVVSAPNKRQAAAHVNEYLWDNEIHRGRPVHCYELEELPMVRPTVRKL